MTTLLLAGLSNALVASGLALLAFAVGRWWKKHPGIAHALWLLVLVKLLTPPIVPVPFEWTITREVVAAPREPKAVASANNLTQSLIYGPVPYLGQQTFDFPPPTNNLETTFKEGLIDPATGNPMLVIEVKPQRARFPMPVPVIPDTGVQASDPNPGPIVATAIAEPNDPVVRQPEPSFPWINVLLAVWLGGTVCWLVFAALRIARFHRLLRNATVPAASIQREFDALSQRMGFRRAPILQLLPGAVTPLVWAVGRAKIYFPADLLQQLSASQRQTLFAHELAHLKRRDHWVRWLELVAVSWYWWLPVAWFARRQLQRAEEECCDSWVVETLPGSSKSYASALLDTLDFLADSRPAPAVASGVGRVPSIQKRLLMILHGTPRRRPTLVSRLTTAVCALIILPLAPTLAQRVIEVEKAPESPTRDVAIAADEDKLPELAAPFEPFAYQPRSTVLQSPKSSWWSLAISPDNKIIATTLGRGGTHPGEIQLWNAQTGKLTRTIAEAGTVRCIAFSPDGKFFATGSFDNALRIYDTQTGAVGLASGKHGENASFRAADSYNSPVGLAI